MQPSLDPIRALAFEAAQLDLAVTNELVGHALNLPPDTAREAAARGAFAGLLRPRKLPGFGNKTIYQPTARAAGLPPSTAPFSLRRAAPSETVARSLIRGAVRYQLRPDLTYLPRAEVAALYHQYGVHQHGHPSGLIGLDGAHFHVFFPLLIEAGTSPSNLIERVTQRHYNLLEGGCATIKFVAFTGPQADAIQRELDQLSPESATESARAELAALDAKIAADRTGLTTLQSAGRRAELTAIIAANEQEQAEDDLLPWLDRTALQVSV